MKNIKKALLLAIALSTGAFAGFDFGGCSGSGTFNQAIESYGGDYDKAVTVGEIPAGIKGLQIELISDKDVDIRLYGANNTQIVAWPRGLINTLGPKTIQYNGVLVSYSGFNGIGGELGHETISVEGTLPENMTMKAFGYVAGDATVNYSWSGKEGCTDTGMGSGTFNQAIPYKAVTTIGEIPSGISNLEINLTAATDLDIQLFGEDGTAIVQWPSGLMNGPSMKEIDYHGMHIVYSGYFGVDGQRGHEYIKVTNATTEALTMKAYGYKAGEAVVNYSWGEDNGGGNGGDADFRVTLSPATQTVKTGENGSIAVTVEDVNNTANGISGKAITLSANTGSSTSGSCTTNTQGTCTITVTDTVKETVVYTVLVDGAAQNSSNTATVTFTSDTNYGKEDGLIVYTKSDYTASPVEVLANGNDFSTYTLTLKDYDDKPVNTSLNHVVVTPMKTNTNQATIEDVDYSQASEGIYTFKVSDTLEELVSIKVCISYFNNKQVKQADECSFPAQDVNFEYPNPSNWKVTLSPDTQNVTVGTEGTIFVKVVDVDYPDINITGKEISLIADTGSSTFNTCTTDAQGECSITVTDTVAQTVVYTPRANGSTPNTASNSATVVFTPGVVNPGLSTITANPTRLVADGVETSTVVVTAKDVYGNVIDDATVSLSQGAGHSNISAVNNNNNGTYNFSVSNANVENVVYRARINGVIILQNVSVIYDETTTVTYIASIYDNTPYNPAIDYQGVIDASGHEVLLPYIVAQTVSIPAYSQSKLVNASKTSNDESGLRLVLSYPSQTLTAGSGNIVARITVNDIEGDEDGTYNARKIDVDQGAEGVNVVSWNYHVNTLGAPSYVTLKITAGIPDRMFGKADNNGDTNSHDFLYLPVTNPATGRTWLNNNLGADYTNIHSPNFNPGQQAKSPTDYFAYGSLFQWGRKADGHELIRWTSNTNGTGVHGSNGTNSNNPTHALFIPETGVPYDWRINQDNTLWASESSTNNICPIGYRVPLDSDWYSETQTWSSKRAAGALSSTLALPMPGFRSYDDAIVYTMVDFGYYWSGSVDARRSRFLLFSSGDLLQVTNVRAHGFSIRCIKD